MSDLRTLDDVIVRGRKVLVRLDLNVPMQDGVITDTTRIDRAMTTLKELLVKEASPLILSHFDRPKGKVVASMSLLPMRAALEEGLGRPVRFIETDWRDQKAQEAAEKIEPGEVLLLENTRFHPGEEENDPLLARKFADLADVYVNDAFSVAHRAHASTEGVAHLLPSVAGRAMEWELRALKQALNAPQRPLLAVVGGAKVSTKLEVLGNLLSTVDILVIGGAMANTFLATKGYSLGCSLYEPNLVEEARTILEKAKERGCLTVLPQDAVVATALSSESTSRITALTKIKPNEMILDIGPNSIQAVERAIDQAKTVVWNGPFGAFEVSPFDLATKHLAAYVAQRTHEGQLMSVAGGGDTVSALEKADAIDGFSYVSTAGGAFLEWLEGKDLPGVKILEVQ